jgi:hypothetical protein
MTITTINMITTKGKASSRRGFKVPVISSGEDLDSSGSADVVGVVGAGDCDALDSVAAGDG